MGVVSDASYRSMVTADLENNFSHNNRLWYTSPLTYGKLKNSKSFHPEQHGQVDLG